MTVLNDYLKVNGQFPRVNLRIIPLDNTREILEITEFLSYSFQSSILVPVDTFTFTFTSPGSTGSFLDYVQEGDIVELQCNDQIISTGIVDMVDIDTSVEAGEIVTVTGRDLMAQLEDQNAISVKDEPIYSNRFPVKSVAGTLIKSTKIRGLKLQDSVSGSWLFATEPNESKLAALQRYLEPLNLLAWMSPEGSLIIGKPNMSQEPLGELVMSKETRNTTNVMQMKASYASSQIPNIIVPIWTGQENVQGRVPPSQRLLNTATGPSRLRKQNFLVPRAIVVSTPQGSDPQSLADINTITKAGGSNILQAYAKREIARANVNELLVQVVTAGHLNDEMIPFQADQVYMIRYPRASVSEKMYLMGVQYSCDAKSGPKTTLTFCKLGRIVADVKVNGQTVKLYKASEL